MLALGTWVLPRLQRGEKTTFTNNAHFLWKLGFRHQQLPRKQSQSIISTVKKYRLRASQLQLSQRQSYFGIQPPNNILIDIFRSCLLMSVTHWQLWVSSHQRVTVSKRQINMFALSLEATLYVGLDCYIFRLLPLSLSLHIFPLAWQLKKARKHKQHLKIYHFREKKGTLYY